MSHDDASYKTLFAAPEVMRDLLLGFVPDDWLHGLDYRTLERVSGSYVTDDLRDRADDIVWRVKVGGEWVYLYLLIEFQSTVDAWMAVRIMTYVGLLYQDLIKQKQVLPERRLPPVLPELKRIFAIWIRAMVLRHSRNRLVLPKVRDLQELKMILADRFETWAREHEHKGIEKGIEKGEALLLQRLLVRRFGPLPGDLMARIGSATQEQIERWSDRVLDAASLEDVFRP
ncbi:MAG: Rpn family recombination-promoting nuclease/putative transposase [Candidatus Competibacter sp.]